MKEKKKFFAARKLITLIVFAIIFFMSVSLYQHRKAEIQKKEVEAEKEVKEIVAVAFILSYDIGYKKAEAKMPIDCNPIKLSEGKKEKLFLAAIMCDGYFMGYNDFLQGKPNKVTEAIEKDRELREKHKKPKGNKKDEELKELLKENKELRI